MNIDHTIIPEERPKLNRWLAEFNGTKKMCELFAKKHYAKTKSYIGTLGHLLDNPIFKDLTEEEVDEIVKGVIEESNERQSSIYYQ